MLENIGNNVKKIVDNSVKKTEINKIVKIFEKIKNDFEKIKNDFEKNKK